MTTVSRIRQIEEEIKTLKESLKKPHLIKDAEGDYDIKSQIIDKQNEMIELLTEMANRTTK
jgi:phosphoribosylaminoimidazole carboxylase (NCAIR synthetase)